MGTLWVLFPESLRVQVPDNQILTQDLYYNCYYPDRKYLTIGYMDPLGTECSRDCTGLCFAEQLGRRSQSHRPRLAKEE